MSGIKQVCTGCGGEPTLSEDVPDTLKAAVHVIRPGQRCCWTCDVFFWQSAGFLVLVSGGVEEHWDYEQGVIQLGRYQRTLSNSVDLNELSQDVAFAQNKRWTGCSTSSKSVEDAAKKP